MFEDLFGTNKKKLRKQQENVFDRFHRGKFHPESEYSKEDAEFYKKNMYGDKYDPDYDEKREARLKKKYGKNYIENYDQKLWCWNGKSKIK